ncbi:hypothetical protein ONZ43_g554 [Nemania bipapillata]|uniref:Uncharacterized protein n=1 Tax=Nemania bipapillata TaxID=110536 RepID=A0ACC2J7W9_9PEZI|nr:hypothetical protein ONZ43_g554 [Nemania bipapillata]
MTSTSHTLTNAPSLSFLSALTDSTKPSGGMEMLALFEAFKASNRHDFLQPSVSLPNASLQLAKSTLDAYASQLSDEQQQRQKEANKKRKRADLSYGPIEVLKVRKLHVDGFESGQVWQQAKRIITSTLQDAERMLQELEHRNKVQIDGIDKITDISELDGNDPGDISHMSADDSVTGSDEADEEDEEDEEAFEDEEPDSELEGDVGILEDDVNGGVSDDEEDAEEDEDGDDDDDEPEPLVEDPNGLNDGFFSIDDFNKQTQMWEAADARADPNVDQGNEDEELDWHADPYSMKQQPTIKKGSKKSKHQRDNEDDEMESSFGDEDDDDDGGATFGDMDLYAPEGDSEIEDERDAGDDPDEGNANDVFYKDFFAPPRSEGGQAEQATKAHYDRTGRSG